jgi:hypothetical protein
MNADYRVPAGTQLTHADIRIGVGNIWRELALADGDAGRAPLGAGLWIFVRDHPEHDRRLRVRAGDLLQIGDHVVTVLGIDGESVTLAFASPSLEPTIRLGVTA